MKSLSHLNALFKYRHFGRESIILCVRRYLSDKLRYRDLVETMAARGVKLAHTTVLRWVHASCLSSKSAACVMPVPSGSPGVSTRPTFASEGSGVTFHGLVCAQMAW